MNHKKIRISKLLANYNYGSRREIEKLIIEKKIRVNNQIITSPIFFPEKNDKIFINNNLVKLQKVEKIYKIYKPINYISSKKRQDKRNIIYDILPEKFLNYIFAGRLDVNSEGLMIFSNSSLVTRNLELPENEFLRKYRVRVYGNLNFNKLDIISKGYFFKNLRYKPFNYQIISKVKKNTWLEIELLEGKNNEIRNIFKHLGLMVNKLIRFSYGPFLLDKMKPGDIKEVSNLELKKYENHIWIKTRQKNSITRS